MIDHGAFSQCANLEEVKFRGFLPGLGSYVFDGTSATIYYRLSPRRTAVTMVADRPAVIWPEVALVERKSDRFSFEFSVSRGKEYIIEATTNPAHGVWAPIETNSVGTVNRVFFTDTSTADHPQRFYRVVLK